MSISEEDVQNAKKIFDDQFMGVDYEKVGCLLSILLLEEIQELRRVLQNNLPTRPNWVTAMGE